MPLNTKVIRNGKDVKMPHGWGYETLGCFLTAAIIEQNPDFPLDGGGTVAEMEGTGRYFDVSMWPIYYMDMPIDLWTKNKQVLERDHSFPIYEDGKSIEFKAGDVLKMWRD